VNPSGSVSGVGATLLAWSSQSIFSTAIAVEDILFISFPFYAIQDGPSLHPSCILVGGAVHLISVGYLLRDAYFVALAFMLLT
jgi:hypothetical protein